MSIVDDRDTTNLYGSLNISDTREGKPAQFLINGIPVGGGSSSAYTYGVRTNAQILAIPGPSNGETAWSSDDLTAFTYFNGSWYNAGQGVLS